MLPRSPCTTLLTNPRIVRSKLFTFYVGKAKQAFVVHSKAIAATSAHFNALINNDMVESQRASAELDDVEPEDFARFVEYAYRSNYTSPALQHERAAEDEVGGDSGGTMDAESSISQSLDRIKKTGPSATQKRFRILLDSFGGANGEPDKLAERKHGLGHSRYPASSHPSEDENTKSIAYLELTIAEMRCDAIKTTFDNLTRFKSVVYLLPADPAYEMEKERAPKVLAPVGVLTDQFLAHARLYTFADMRLVEPLKRLVLHKLHHLLADYPLDTGCISDLVQLIEYAYDHGGDRDDDGKLDELRELVVVYAGFATRKLIDNACLLELLGQGGQFAQDCWRAKPYLPL